MANPIRVLNLFAVLDRGGAETFVMNVYRNIDREKVQFDFLVHGDKIGEYEEEITALGGKIYRMPRISVKNFFQYKKQLKDFFEKHKEYEIVHSHISELGWPAFSVASKMGVPCLICHAHGYAKGFRIKDIIKFPFMKGILKYSTDRFACSDLAGQWQYGKHLDYVVINNGIDTEQFKFDSSVRDEYRKQLGVENEMIIGHVGRFDDNKNQQFLVEIIEYLHKKNNNIKLCLVGDGKTKHEIENLVEAKGLKNAVSFLGVRDDVDKLMQMFDVFAFPSVFEGLGIVAVEAQCASLPCVISDGIPNEAIITENVFAVPLSEGAPKWAEEILKIDCSSRQQDAEASKEAVLKAGYDIKLTAKKLQDFYEEKL